VDISVKFLHVKFGLTNFANFSSLAEIIIVFGIRKCFVNTNPAPNQSTKLALRCMFIQVFITAEALFRNVLWLLRRPFRRPTQFKYFVFVLKLKRLLIDIYLLFHLHDAYIFYFELAALFKLLGKVQFIRH